MQVGSTMKIDNEEYAIISRKRLEQLEALEAEYKESIRVEKHPYINQIHIGGPDYNDFGNHVILRVVPRVREFQRFMDEVRVVLPHGERVYKYERVLSPEEAKKELIDNRNYGWWKS